MNKNVCKEVIRNAQRICKASEVLSDETIDNLAEDLLNNDQLLEKSSSVLNLSVVSQTRRAVIMGIGFALLYQGLYVIVDQTTKAANSNEEEDEDSEDESEDEDSGVEED